MICRTDSTTKSQECARDPRVAIIVLNWNGLDDTRACAASLAQITYPAATVYLVDNGSTDGSQKALAREFPHFTHVANQTNLGFTGGNNAVIERVLAEFDYVLLLNNDTHVAPDFLEHLVAAAEADARVGMVGPKILYDAEPDVLWYAGGEVRFNDWFPLRHTGQNEQDRGQHDTPGETDFITGCCLLARADLIRQVGTLDPAFGYYCEDVDWCLRARRAGWRLRYAPQSRVWHKVSRSTERGATRPLYYFTRNPWLLARRHQGTALSLPVLLRTGWLAVIHPGGAGPAEQAKALVLDAAWDALWGRTGTRAQTGPSRGGRVAARLLRLPTRAYWWLNALKRSGADRRRRRGPVTTVAAAPASKESG